VWKRDELHERPRARIGIEPAPHGGAMTGRHAQESLDTACFARRAVISTHLPANGAPAYHARHMSTTSSSIRPMRARRPAALLLFAAAALAGCGSTGAGIGVGMPILPGVSLGVGVGSGGGVNVGVGTGVGPVRVGVGVNQRGQVTGGVGVGASVPAGDARVGVGVGTGRVLHDPKDED
jgi:hypothetical protein